MQPLRGRGQFLDVLVAQMPCAGALEVLVPQRSQEGDLRQLVHPGRGGVGVDGVQQRQAVHADLFDEFVGGGVLAAQQAAGLDLAAVAFVPARPGDDEARAGPGDLLQCRPQSLAQGLDPVQPSHAGDDMRGVGALAAAGLDQPGLFEAFQHQAQQPVGPALQREAGAELRQGGEVEARVVQLEAERVFPGDTVRDGLGSLTVGEVVPELQDGHDQEERR